MKDALTSNKESLRWRWWTRSIASVVLAMFIAMTSEPRPSGAEFFILYAVIRLLVEIPDE